MAIWKGIHSRRTDPKIYSREKLASMWKNIHPCVAIHVFTYNRAIPTAELLEKLATSDYSSYDKDLPLVIHLDRPRDDAPNNTICQNKAVERLTVDFEWPNGPKLLDIQSEHVGLKMSWLCAWQDPNMDDISIALEEDMDLSPLYFHWLLHVLGSYNLWKTSNCDPSLLCVSLSPILFNEISLFGWQETMFHRKCPLSCMACRHRGELCILGSTGGGFCRLLR